MFLVKCYAHFIFNTYHCQISLYRRYADVYSSHWWMKGPGLHTFLTLHIIILFILCQSDKIKIWFLNLTFYTCGKVNIVSHFADGKKKNRMQKSGDICKASHTVDVSHSGIKPRFVRLQTSHSFHLAVQSHLCQTFHTVIRWRFFRMLSA